MITITVPTQWFFTPDDDVAALAEYLRILNNPFETWVLHYGFTLREELDRLKAAHRAGILLHVGVDHTEETCPTQHADMQELVDEGIELFVGTSPKGRGLILHDKTMVAGDECWAGSINSSKQGFEQANVAASFVSRPWADLYIARFKAFRRYAWTEERSYQLMAQAPIDL